MEVLQKLNELDCNRCNFHGTDYKTVQIHMGTIHPEFCEEIDTGGLGKLVFYQKSARLFHCHRCFFTSKMFSSVYYHILSQHTEPDKQFNKSKSIKEPKSEQGLFQCSDKKDSEHMVSEDEKSVEEKLKLKEVKAEENDTLTSWPENVSCQVTQDNSDIEFKSSSSSSSSSMDKSRTIFQETKDTSCDPESSSSSSDNISTKKSAQANAGVEFSSNDIATLPSKDIPEFSDEDDEPALPGGIPQFSDDETVTQSKDAPESSDYLLHDQSRGIEDISEDEMPLEEKPIDNISEDESAPVQSKLEESSEEEDMSAPAKEMMEFSDDDEEDNLALSKDDMEFSEEEVSDKPKNVETTAPKNDFSEEEEITNASRNVMEFSEEEENPGLSKEIMDFSEDDDDDDDDDDTAPAMPKSIMEFSEEEDVSPQSKDMPKYLEGNSTPSKDSENNEDADMSVFKGSSPISEDGATDEFTPIQPKDLENKSKGLTGTARLSGTVHFSDYSGTPSWSKDGLDTSDSGDISLSAPDSLDLFDDKDGLLKDEEISKHVKRIKGKYQCLLCEYRPLNRGPILNHLITKHNMPSPFICKICGETFAVETHLKHHSSAHTKGLYKCQKCNFQTDHPRGFKKHQTHCESRRHRHHHHKDEGNKPVLDFPEGEPEEH